MEPLQYIDFPAQHAQQGFTKAQLKDFSRQITDQYEERLVACLLKEKDGNPFKNKFNKLAVSSVIFMITALILFIWSLLENTDASQITWQLYLAFAAFFASLIFAYICRTVLRQYVRFIIQHYCEQKGRPVCY